VKVLVVGGSQFNGLALVRQLVREEHDVTVLNRGRSEAPIPATVRRLTGDRTDVRRMRTLLGSEEFDCVYDMCAYHPPDVELMTDLFRGRTGHYVFISSIAIYAPSEILPITEDFPVDRGPKQNEYGLHKILCEDHLLAEHDASGFPVTTVILPMVIGPRNIMPDREQRMFVRMQKGRPILIPGDGTALSQVGYVDDHAEALCAMMGRSNTFGQRYNLTGSQFFSDEGYVDVMADVIGTEVEKVFIPADLMDQLWDGEIETGRMGMTSHIDIRSTDVERENSAARMQRFQLATLVQKAQPNLHRWNHSLVLSVDKLARDIGWRPRHNFRQAVARTFEWFQQQDQLDHPDFDFSFEDSILDLMRSR
jgi:nucleoside-diphosphate-sugar epimerase